MPPLSHACAVARTGAYLTDGDGLFCVREADGGTVWLEDCMLPDGPWLPVDIGPLVASYRVVRPGA